MKKLEALLDEEGGTLLAWCLMGNHFHLLATIPFERLNELMHRLQTSYAGYFNRVYGHVGAVFEGRFKSEPVETDEYLMTVVRREKVVSITGSITHGVAIESIAEKRAMRTLLLFSTYLAD